MKRILKEVLMYIMYILFFSFLVIYVRHSAENFKEFITRDDMMLAVLMSYIMLRTIKWLFGIGKKEKVFTSQKEAIASAKRMVIFGKIGATSLIFAIAAILISADSNWAILFIFLGVIFFFMMFAGDSDAEARMFVADAKIEKKQKEIKEKKQNKKYSKLSRNDRQAAEYLDEYTNNGKSEPSLFVKFGFSTYKNKFILVPLFSLLGAIPIASWITGLLGGHHASSALFFASFACVSAIYMWKGFQNPKHAWNAFLWSWLIGFPILLIPAFFYQYWLYKKTYSSGKTMENLNLKSEKMDEINGNITEDEEKGEEMESVNEILDLYGNNKLAFEGSFKNRDQHRDGYQWTTPIELAKFSEGKDIYLDNFAYSEEVLEKNNALDESGYLEREAAKSLQRIEAKVNPLDLTKTALYIGSMGSGKTEAINSLISQEFYNRALINDIKGDFVEKFYNPQKDIIFNLFDERTCSWDIFREMQYNPEVATEFVKNLVKASISDEGKGDFFSNQAAKIITEAFLKVAFLSDTTNKKWEQLTQKLDNYKDNAGDDKTKSSIALTMDLSIEVLKLMAYRAKDTEGFTITEYFSKKQKQKLFLLNNPAYSSKLTPLFTGFMGAVTAILLGRGDTKDDFTLIVLDEFLSLKFDKATRQKLMTLSRSKGGCLLLATQFLPNDKDTKQLLDSSRYLLQIFQTNDLETVKNITSMAGKVEYKETNYSVSESRGGGRGNRGGNVMDITGGNMFAEIRSSKNYSKSTQVRQSDFLTTKHIQSMKNYTHISFFPSEDIIYLGYTKMVDLPKINKNFEPIEMQKYYAYLYSDVNPDLQEATIEVDLFDILDEESKWVHWYNIAFAESDENLEEYIRKHDLNDKSIATLYELFDVDAHEVEKAEERLSEEERLELSDKFFGFETDKERYQLIKKHRLLKTLISIFVLSSDFIIDKMEEIEKKGE